MSGELSRALQRAGFTAAETTRRLTLLQRAGDALRGMGGTASTALRWYHVPGRIEVLGKHTDYAGGRSLLCATEQGIALVAGARSDAVVRVVDTTLGSGLEFPLRAGLEPDPGHWSAYVMTVGRRLARDFPELDRGVNLAFAGDLPPAAGLSSSSALIVGAYLALADANRLGGAGDFGSRLAAPEQLADYLGAVESGKGFGPSAPDRGVGTQGGSEDHTAILCAQSGRLVQYGFDPVRLERAVPLPDGLRFAVAVSGVAAEKTGAARERFNELAALTAELLRLWVEAGEGSGASLIAALQSEPDGPARLCRAVETARSPLPRERLLARVAQVWTESQELVPAASEALAPGKGDLAQFGSVVERSQRGAEEGLGNQVPETTMLVRLARELGAVAASAFGAGFGGSVWALVRDAEAPPFVECWRRAYLERFPARAGQAAWLTTRPAPPAVALEWSPG